MRCSLPALVQPLLSNTSAEQERSRDTRNTRHKPGTPNIRCTPTLLVTLLILVATPLAAFGQTGKTFTWAAGSGYWEQAANWDPLEDAPPGSQDEALLLSPAHIYLGGSTTVKKLTYDIPAGPASEGFRGEFDIGTENLTVTEQMTWRGGGGWRSMGTLTVSGVFELQADQYDHSHGAIVNGGNAVWQSGTFAGTPNWDASVFQNEGTLSLRPPEGIDLTFCFLGGPYLRNSATAQIMQDGLGRTLLQCQLDNKGLVRVAAGELALAGAVGIASTDSYPGPFEVFGGRLAFVGNEHVIESTSRITGPGTLAVVGAPGGGATTLTVLGTINVDSLHAIDNAQIALNGPVTLRNVVLAGGALNGTSSYAIPTSTRSDDHPFVPDLSGR